MLKPVFLRDLLLDPGSHPRRQPHLSAASGLVQVGHWLYMVADDEHHLGMLEDGARDVKPVLLQRIFADDLPEEKDERKKLKPDLEALLLLPTAPGHPYGALMAMGSGSRPNRQQAVALALDELGRLTGAASTIDLADLYQPLRSSFPDLNIEGAFVANERFHLLQRGNKGDATSACIEYSLNDVQDWLAGRRSMAPVALRIVPFALGQAGGVPLGFTDGTALPGGGWLFSAVAEDSADSYADGPCAGSAIGWVNTDGELLRLEPIAGAPKVEGIALDGVSRLLLVTDSDDPARASQLLAVGLG